MHILRKTFTTLGSWWRSQSIRKKILLGVGLLVVLYIIFHKGTSDTNTSIETVRRQDLFQTISASGMVVSLTDLSLGFEQSKMVKSVPAVVGVKVRKGDVLASLSSGSERAAVSSAKGTLLAARARYNKVLEGSSNEEIELAQIELANAKRTLMNQDLEAKPDSSTETINPIISGMYTGEEGEYTLEFNRYPQNVLRYNRLEKGSVQLSDIRSVKLGTKGLYVQFPKGTLNTVTHGMQWKLQIPNIEGSSYVANKAVVDQKEAALALVQATARQTDVDEVLADVVTAQAGVDSAIAALEKTILRAPADGTITVVDIKIGEIAQIGKQAIALQDVSNLYLEANVNESNIKGVVVGQNVTVTFDAFAGDTYQATVSSVDPAATIDNNIVNYKIKALLTDTERIRPGMTANMTVLTAQAANVLVLPNRVITTVDGVSTVVLGMDDQKQKTTSQVVTTGLVGDGDMVEIQTGLKEGDRVLWTSN